MTHNSKDEVRARWANAQALMAQSNLDAILVSNIPNFRYFTGHVPPIAVSPTRPWYALLPREGELVAVVPDIGVADFELEGHAGRVLNWACPNIQGDGIEGVTQLLDALNGLPFPVERLGVELGRETRIGMNVADLNLIGEALGADTLVDCADLVSQLRMVKSADEAAMTENAAAAVHRAFERLPDLFDELGEAPTEQALHKAFLIEILRQGADDVPYLIVNAGQNGYRSLTRGPTDRIIQRGDMIGIDVGARIEGYWSDYNRNFAVGDVPADAAAFYAILTKALDAGIDAVQPGVRVCDVWQAMNDTMGEAGSKIGRMGHGVGLDLTERPSVHPNDTTEIRAGMVLAIEPSLNYPTGDGGQALMVREELVVANETGARMLTTRAPDEVPVLKL